MTEQINDARLLPNQVMRLAGGDLSNAELMELAQRIAAGFPREFGPLSVVPAPQGGVAIVAEYSAILHLTDRLKSAEGDAP